MKMNNSIENLSILILLLVGLYLPKYLNANTLTDTLVIELGNEEKIIIQLPSKQSLGQLKQIDMNAILEELTENLDVLDEVDIELEQLHLEDSFGHWLKGDTIIFKDLDHEKRIKKRIAIEKIEGEEHEIEQKMKVLEQRLSDLDIDIDFENELEHEYHIKLHHEVPTPPELDIDIECFHEDCEASKLRTTHYLNLELGLNNYLENGAFPDQEGQLYALDPLGSRYVAITSTLKTHIKKPFFLEWGASFDWYNFRLDNHFVQLNKGDQSVDFNALPPDFGALKSKLTSYYLNVKLIPVIDFKYRSSKRLEVLERHKKEGFRIGLGPYLGYRMGSYSKLVYHNEGKKQTNKQWNNFFMSNWRYGIRFQMGYRGVDLFAQYDLNPLFFNQKGPKLNAFSFGVVI